MSVKIPERCECGRCFGPGTARDALVRGLAEEWVRVERGWAAHTALTWEPCQFGLVDALEALELCRRIGHIPEAPADAMLELAADVSDAAAEIAQTSW